MLYPICPSTETQAKMRYPSPTEYEGIMHLQGDVLHKDGLRVGNVAVESDEKGNLRLSRRFHTEEQKFLLKAIEDSSDKAPVTLVPDVVPRPPDPGARPRSSTAHQRSRVVKFNMDTVSGKRPSSPGDILGSQLSPRPQSGSSVEHDAPIVRNFDRRSGSAPSTENCNVGQRARGRVVVSSNIGRRNPSADRTTRQRSSAIGKLVVVPARSAQVSKPGSRRGRDVKDCEDDPNQVSNYPNLAEWMKLEAPCVSPVLDTHTTFGIEGVRAHTSEKKERVTGSVLYI